MNVTFQNLIDMNTRANCIEVANVFFCDRGYCMRGNLYTMTFTDKNTRRVDGYDIVVKDDGYHVGPMLNMDVFPTMREAVEFTMESTDIEFSTIARNRVLAFVGY